MARSRRTGVTVEEYGDDYVFLAIQGVSRGRDQAQIKFDLSYARRLAVRLLQVAERQEKHMAALAERGGVQPRKRKPKIQKT